MITTSAKTSSKIGFILLILHCCVSVDMLIVKCGDTDFYLHVYWNRGVRGSAVG
jgi:hypothetical protein